MGKTDVIERTITVSAPIDRVWRAITAADELAQWFGDSAKVDLRPGGSMQVGWSEYDVVVDCVVEEVDAPNTFTYRWTAGPTKDGSMWSTRVTFTLDEDDGMTTITVVESGLAALPGELYDKTLEENSSGWESELTDLASHLAA